MLSIKERVSGKGTKRGLYWVLDSKTDKYSSLKEILIFLFVASSSLRKLLVKDQIS